MEHELLSCSICFDPFDGAECIPLSLECGHTLCKRCIVSGGLLACSTCRHPISRPASQLRPNYGLIQAIEPAGQIIAGMVEQAAALLSKRAPAFVV